MKLNIHRRHGCSCPEECDKPYIRIRGSRLGGRYKIANVLTPVYDGVPDREVEETRANAKFIVSACNSYYDLFKAIENANFALSQNGAIIQPGSPIHEQFKQALAKAGAQ